MFSAVLSIFLLMFVGVIARRAGVLQAGDTHVVRSIVANITGPAFVFASIYGKPVTSDMTIAPVIHFVSMMVVVGVAYLLARLMNLDRPTTGGLMLAAAFGNTGFLGYPITQAAFPHEKTALATAVIVDQLGMTVPLYSIGIAIAVAFGSSSKEKINIFGFLKTPLFISMALVLMLRTVYLPPFLVKSIGYLGAATVPLAMMSLGLSITRIPLKSFSLPFVAACVLKFVALPLLALLGLRFAGVGGNVYQVSMLESAMPTAIMASVIAGKYGANGAFVSGATFLMTLMSVLLIPAVLLLVN